MSSEFSDSGTKTHDFNAKTQGSTVNDFVQIRGTYMGAVGTYSCAAGATATPPASTCTSDLNANESITLSEGWSFTADEGATVKLPDAEYLHFGWWLRDTTADDTGTDRMVSTFFGATGIAAVVDATAATVLGSATYSGAAAGKYRHRQSPGWRQTPRWAVPSPLTPC